MLIVQLSLIFLIYIPNSSCVIEIMYNAGKEICELYLMLDKVTLRLDYDFMNFDKLFTGNDSSREIKNQMDIIHTQLDQIEQSIASRTIVDSLNLSPSTIMILTSLDTFELSVKSIDDSYVEFIKYMNKGEQQSFRPLYGIMRNISLKVEGENIWIREIMTDTHAFLPKYKNIVEAISGHAKDQATSMCDGHQIISEILIHLFKRAMMAELKTNFMIALGNIYQYPKNEGWKTINSFAKSIFEEQFSARINIFSWNIAIVDSLYLRSCDPVDGAWIRNENFFELGEISRKTIFRYHWGMCKYGSCNAIRYVRNRCEPEIYDRRTACMETSGSCTYLSAITACALKTGPYRFQFVNSSELGPLGTNFQCPKDNGYIINDGTGWNASYATCACDCYSTRNKISLVLMESAVRLNRIITGLRFVRINRILYIQPKESLFSPNDHGRYVNRWITIPKKPQIHTIDKGNRTFFLDDLRLPSGYVLTGVKFNKVVRGTLHGFALEIFGVPFDYETGKLNPDNKYRISRKVLDESLGVGINFQKIESTHTKLQHKPTVITFDYVTLVQSSLTFDFGQTTLPFFDAVPVVTSPPSILGGIGIFYKGVPDYAGLISLRLYGIDYVQYFSNFQFYYMENNTVVFVYAKRD